MHTGHKRTHSTFDYQNYLFRLVQETHDEQPAPFQTINSVWVSRRSGQCPSFPFLLSCNCVYPANMEFNWWKKRRPRWRWYFPPLCTYWRIRSYCCVCVCVCGQVTHRVRAMCTGCLLLGKEGYRLWMFLWKGNQVKHARESSGREKSDWTRHLHPALQACWYVKIGGDARTTQFPVLLICNFICPPQIYRIK